MTDLSAVADTLTRELAARYRATVLSPQDTAPRIARALLSGLAVAVPGAAPVVTARAPAATPPSPSKVPPGPVDHRGERGSVRVDDVDRGPVAGDPVT